MKKVMGILFVSAFVAISAAGCGSATVSDSKATNTNVRGAKAGNKDFNGSPVPIVTGSGINGNRQFSIPDLTGEVVTIVGNEVTVKVIEMPKITPGALRGQQGNQSGTQGAAGGQGTGAFVRGQGNGQGTGQGQGGGQFSGGQRTVKYTGETKTITLPIGIPVMTTVRTTKGREDKEVNIKDLKKGDVLTIWYSDKQSEAISRINLRSVTQSSGQGGGFGGGMGGGGPRGD